MTDEVHQTTTEQVVSKADYDSLVSQVSQLQESLEKVTANRDTILQEKRELKGSSDEYRTSLARDYESRLAAEAESRKASEERVKTLESHLNKTFGSGELQRELSKYDLIPETMEMAEQYLSPRVSVREVDGQWVGHMDGDKSISEAVKEWAESPQGLALRKSNSQPANRNNLVGSNDSQSKSFYNPQN